MKKFAKMSLVAAVAVAGFSTAQADTLAEAFAASKVKGEIKSQYFEKETDAGAESSIWVNGGNLSLTTGSFYGLTAGVTFQTSHVATVDGTGYAGDMDASGSVMSEAYLAYTLANTTAKVGRQYIATPLVSGSGSRMIKTSFEGAVLINTDVPNTTLVASYVDKIANRTDGAGNVDGFNQGIGKTGDGAYTVLVANNSIENLGLTAQYAQVNDLLVVGQDVKVMFAEAAYKIGAVKISGEYVGSDNGAAANSDGQMLGLKVDASIAGVALTAAYTTTDDEAGVVRGLGAGAFPGYAKLTIGSGDNSYAADTDSYMISASYKIADIKLGAGYADYDTNGGAQTSETELNAAYSINKNASLSLVYTTFGKDDTKDYNFRSYFSYKF